MIITNWNYVLLFIVTYFLVGFLTPLMRSIAIGKKILDYPNSSHKTHLTPIPYLGGVAIILGVIIVTYSALLYSNSTYSKLLLATSIIGPALIMGLVGLWDDIKSLHPFPRFVAQTLTGIFVALILIITDSVGTPTGSIFVDGVVTVIWVVGITNSINFFDNLDGGASGTVAISSITLAYLAIFNNQSLIGAFSTVVSGAALGFLFWNKSPARIYMGDAGSLFLGVLMATLTIRLKPSSDVMLSSFATPILLLAVPILDTSVSVISRFRRRISPFQGGKDHLSHRLIRLGLSRKSAVVILWLMSSFFCFLAALVPHLNSNEEFLVVIFGTLVWILLFLGFIQRTKSQ
jgi:UDP-GlcNAc:undecaprenyl-phosphate GlcNAc-1-phosphate transferase